MNIPNVKKIEIYKRTVFEVNGHALSVKQAFLLFKPKYCNLLIDEDDWFSLRPPRALGTHVCAGRDGPRRSEGEEVQVPVAVAVAVPEVLVTLG